MKKIAFFILFVFITASCEVVDKPDLVPDSNEIIDLRKQESGKTKSVSFDWENSQTIPFIDGTQGIKLPWVYESIGNIPLFIRQDYLKADGWELLYNLSDNYNFAKYYIVFYNKFSGKVRVYYYLPTISEGSTGIWALRLYGNNSLLNNIGYFATPINNPKTDPVSYSTNITTDAIHKGFGLGWNVFDTEITYDPNAIGVLTDLQLWAYNSINFSLSLLGSYNEVSAGTIVTSSSSNLIQDLGKTTATGAGGEASEWIKKVIGADDESLIRVAAGAIGGLLSGGTDKIINAGINLLFGTFIGRYSETSTSKIEFKTNGNLQINGTMTTTNSSYIPSVLLPLYNPSDPNIVSGPHYQSHLGVWNLQSNPIVKLNSNAYFSGNYNYIDYYSRTAYIDPSSINVIFNPDLVSEISSYEVSYDLFYLKKFDGNLNWRASIDNTPGTFSYCQGSLCYKDSGFEIYSHPSEVIEIQNYEDPPEIDPNEEQGLQVLTFPYINNHYVVKVTVKIFPNSNYNQDPFIITRTYLPDFVFYEE